MDCIFSSLAATHPKWVHYAAHVKHVRWAFKEGKPSGNHTRGMSSWRGPIKSYPLPHQLLSFCLLLPARRGIIWSAPSSGPRCAYGACAYRIGALITLCTNTCCQSLWIPGASRLRSLGILDFLWDQYILSLHPPSTPFHCKWTPIRASPSCYHGTFGSYGRSSAPAREGTPSPFLPLKPWYLESIYDDLQLSF